MMLSAKNLVTNYTSVVELEDNANAPTSVLIDCHDIAEAKANIIGLSVYIGGAGAGLAVVVSGGTLAFAAVIAAAGAVAGASIGVLLVCAIGKEHAERIEAQLGAGGLLLWVRVDPENSERKIQDQLIQAGGQDVHAHTISRHWGAEDIPLHKFNLDPFLEPG